MKKEGKIEEGIIEEGIIEEGVIEEGVIEEGKNETQINKPVCGIIMPISPIDNCTADHWEQVKDILREAISDAGYNANLVSDANDSGIIQKRIIQNIYDNDIVVCDVSGKNPNVMFELGMRLAFDKPTIIVIDDMTDYSFDTSPIEHLSYPRDLRYYSIISFKEKLKSKIIGTIEKAKNDPEYTTFLKNFGQFEVAHLEKKPGSIDDLILSKIEDLGHQVTSLQPKNTTIRGFINSRDDISDLRGKAKEIIKGEIDIYCAINNTDIPTIYFDKNDDREKLYKQLSKRMDIRDLCGDPGTLRSLIDSNLTPF